MVLDLVKTPKSCDKPSGCFIRLRLSDAVPQDLRNEAPEILWLPSHDEISPQSESFKPAITGKRMDEPRNEEVCLVSEDEFGKGHAHFSFVETINGILMEEYREQLKAPLAARLPFNYSLIPGWVKNVGKAAAAGGMRKEPHIHFPEGDPALVVEWLSELAAWCGISTKVGRPFFRWPESYKSALCVSHDVDTDWLFRHPDWMEYICDMEEEQGVRGVWFCVPCHCRNRAAEKGIQRLLDRGCEIGCHGYNHDAKLTFLNGRKLHDRLGIIKEFVDRWRIRGFRSEWLLRTPSHLEKISEIFEYDSSVPNVSSCFTSRTRNGCGTCHPFESYNGMLELPLTVPQDVDRDIEGTTYSNFWSQQLRRAEQIVTKGGLVMISLHPQGHQSANPAALESFGECLKQLTKIPGLWVARPDGICDWVKSLQPCRSGENS